MIAILNKVLANQIPPEAVMSKLDEILKAVNPNLAIRTYFCDGRWRSSGPSADAAFNIEMGGNTEAFQKMATLNNDQKYPELLRSCQTFLANEPVWLTPKLMCGLAYAGLGNKSKAKEMLTAYESQK